MNGQQPAPPTEADLIAQLGEVRAAISALEKQISRAGREQLKANTLASSQTKQFTAALEQLRTADARRETALAELRERRVADMADARLSVVRALLPALDGLDEALRSGQATLARFTDADLLRGLLDLPPAPPSADAALTSTLGAWVQGLEFVRRRLLAVLAAEGVTPIAAVGRPFDPQRHLALEAIPAPHVAPNTVVGEIRRGYAVGERILRHAEVLVAREP